MPYKNYIEHIEISQEFYIPENNICNMKRFIIGIIFLSIFSGCISDIRAPGKQYKDISVNEAKGMIDRGEVFILDVRTREEYAAGHINNSKLMAVQDIPEQEIKERLKELPANRKILVYCKSGSRSAKASKILAENGFAQIYNMKGGITEWTKAGYEVEK